MLNHRGRIMINRVRSNWIKECRVHPKFINIDITVTENHVSNIITRYLFLKERKYIKEPYNNIFYLLTISFFYFLSHLIEIELAYAKKQENKKRIQAYNLIYENNNVRVIQPLTYESAEKHGNGTRWCIAFCRVYWGIYTTGSRSMYFLLPKEGPEKIILYTISDYIFSMTDKEDKSITFSFLSDYMERMCIPPVIINNTNNTSKMYKVINNLT